jgi:AraC family transcriptional regulator of adaptative response/methylated-DNA-[protein]-cysteine methyltransferase
MNAQPTEPQCPALDDDACWAAVCRRDAHGMADFVYAVRSTGIYCRPVCAARRPLRSNVEFLPTPQAAAAAGYRPCKRCRPDASDRKKEIEATMARVCRLIDAAGHLPPLRELAQAAQMSPSHFHRVFKATLGLTPRAYAAGARADRTRHNLRRAPSVTHALHDAGYDSHSAFYGDAGRVLGMSPSAYRSGARGEEIRYAVTRCRLGHVLAAATGRGICAILLGETAPALVSELKRIFPHAVWQSPDRGFEQLLGAVVDLIEDPACPGSTLPLDIRGTAFQQRVWRALRAVPAGTTVSYTELARRIGAPTAVRAVGSACAANLLAVAIPCHRAVRSDGGLSGYRWGIERKRALLEKEARQLREGARACTQGEEADRPRRRRRPT